MNIILNKRYYKRYCKRIGLLILLVMYLWKLSIYSNANSNLSVSNVEHDLSLSRISTVLFIDILLKS